MTLGFRVYGLAQQAGSKRAFVPKGWTRPVITDSNRNLKSWQQLVAEGASRAILELPAAERGLIASGVQITVWFYLPRPKSLPRRVAEHTKAPDLDKLIRALCDALTGVVYRDDAQIVHLIAQKFYASAGALPHVDVLVHPSLGSVESLPLFDKGGSDLNAEATTHPVPTRTARATHARQATATTRPARRLRDRRSGADRA